jgi:hypothetical protein
MIIKQINAYFSFLTKKSCQSSQQLFKAIKFKGITIDDNYHQNITKGQYYLHDERQRLLQKR